MHNNWTLKVWQVWHIFFKMIQLDTEQALANLWLLNHNVTAIKIHADIFCLHCGAIEKNT